MVLLAAAIPGKVHDQARVLYETEEVSLATLAKRFGTNHEAMHTLAEREGWVRFKNGVRAIADDVEAAVMTQDLPHPSPDQVPPHRVRPSIPGRPGREASGRPRRDPQTPLAQALAAARRLYRPGKTNIQELARLLSVDPGHIYKARKREKWDDKPDIPERMVPAVQVLGPAAEDAQKLQLRITLAAIRAAMSVQQIHQLERYEGLLGKYWHWFEVYLSPDEHVDTRHMTPEEAEAALITAQRTALRMIAPTDKDTLQTGLKTLSDALFRSIELKRTVAGLNKVTIGPLPDPGDAGGDRSSAQLLDVDGLSTDDLRAVQRGMELLERHQRDRREVPLPPEPEPLDEFLGPEPEVIEPTMPR